uniref:Uncharacterized protein n=1 Tax=Picea glauca TaxID=3330 RepID=A0A117NGX5_PICGL|nr:hypothetical protein ABT39_MTgene5652 [Picea glauca]
MLALTLRVNGLAWVGWHDHTTICLHLVYAYSLYLCVTLCSLPTFHFVPHQT